MNSPDPPRREPYWLWQTRRLFPHPLFAGCISLASFLVGLLLAGVAMSESDAWFLGIASPLFFAGSFATATAALTRAAKAQPATPPAAQPENSTLAIFILLINASSWILTLTLYTFDSVVELHKQLITLFLAVASTAYMLLHGYKTVRKQLGPQAGSNLNLSGKQAIQVTLFIIALGFYLTWIFN